MAAFFSIGLGIGRKEGKDKEPNKPSARPSRYAYVYSSKTLQMVFALSNLSDSKDVLYRVYPGVIKQGVLLHDEVPYSDSNNLQ